MITIRCPQCRRLLKLPEELRGSQVQCPGCQNHFRTPDGDAPLQSQTGIAPPGQAAPPTPPRRQERAETLRRYEPYPLAPTRPKAVNAAAWLKSAGVFGIISSFLGVVCLCSTSELLVYASRDALALWFVGGIVTVCIWGGVVLGGAGSLRRGQLSGLVRAAAILALLLGIKELVQCGLILVAMASPPFRSGDGVVGLIGLVLSLAVALIAFVAGIKTLSVLREGKGTPINEQATPESILSKSKLKTAATWLWRGVLLSWIGSVLFVVWWFNASPHPPRPGKGEAEIGILLGGLVLFVLGDVIHFGASDLKNGRRSRLAWTAGILAGLLGVKDVCQALVVGFAIGELPKWPDGGFLVGSLVLLLLSAASVVCLVGGVARMVFGSREKEVFQEYH